MSTTYHLINSTITNIKEYPVPDPNNLNPDQYQLYLEELPKQIEQLKNLKKLLEVQKGFGDIDKYLVTTGASPNSLKAILDLVTVNRQEYITDATLIFDGDLDLSDITESIDANRILGNIQTVTGDLNLKSLTSAEGLKLPSSVNGNLYLNGLTSAVGLVLPSSVDAHLDLRGLTSAVDLVLPTSVGGSLNLGRLKSAEGLVLPSSINGHLDLKSLASVEGLVLPSSIGGGLDLESLTSAVGLVLPSSIGGFLDLRSLTSAEGLKLPPGYVGPMYLPTNLKLEAQQDPRFTGVTIDSF